METISPPLPAGYSPTTPLIEIDPEKIRVEKVSLTEMKRLQKAMSHAKWGQQYRNLSFVVTHDEHLLGIICLATPIPRLKARDDFLFPDGPPPGKTIPEAMRSYMDMSVCVGAQPCAWHWNLGKLCAMIAPTLGDKVKDQYGDELLGITTTSWWGANGDNTQYTGVYKLLGETKGFGASHVSAEAIAEARAWAKANGYRRDGALPIGSRDAHRGNVETKTMPNSRWDNQETFEARARDCGWDGETPLDDLPVDDPVAARLGAFYARRDTGKWIRGDGADYKRRTMEFLEKCDGFPRELLPEKLFYHGVARGIYYHDARPPEQRPDAIREWYERWGYPRYRQTRKRTPPYTTGTTVVALDAAATVV